MADLILELSSQWMTHITQLYTWYRAKKSMNEATFLSPSQCWEFCWHHDDITRALLSHLAEPQMTSHSIFRSRAVKLGTVMCAWVLFNLTSATTGVAFTDWSGAPCAIQKTLHLDKQILIKRIYSRYRIHSLPQSSGLNLPWWQGSRVCVYMCSRPPHPTGPRSGLLWADGHNCQSTESTRRRRRGGGGGRGGVVFLQVTM